MDSPEAILKASFLKFVWYVWVRVLRLPAPTRVQLDISRFLEDGPRKRFIAAFRGVGKTFLTAAYIVWRLWRNPDMKILVVSANETFASKVAGFVHAIINAEDAETREDVPWAELRPRQGQRDSILSFDVGPAGPDKDPSVFALGIGGQLPGTRADLILSDDVEVPTNSETEAQREKLISRTAEYASVLKPDGEVIYLGTFQSMQSIYKGLISKGYAMRLWPGRYPLSLKGFYEDHLAPMLKADLKKDPALAKPTGSTLGGAPTDPARFNELDLIERETEMGAAAFQLQFMLDTSLVDQDRYPLKTRDLIVMDVDLTMAPARVAWGSSPELAHKDLDNVGFDGDRMFRPMYRSDSFEPFTGSVLEIDPSGGGRDETSYVVSKFLNGYVYVRRWGGFVDGHGEGTLLALAQIAKDERVNLVRVEANFGDGMFSRLLAPVLRQVGHPVPIEDHKVTGAKERRIMSLVQPALRQHRLVLDTTAAREDLRPRGGLSEESSRVYSGLYQLTHLTEQRGSLKHDDRVDVLANALAYWAEYMGQDARDAEERIRREAEKEYERKLYGSLVLQPDRPRRARGSGRRVR